MLLTSTAVNKAGFEVCSYFQSIRTFQETNAQTLQHGIPVPWQPGPNSTFSIQLLLTDTFPHITCNISLVTVLWIPLPSFENSHHNCFIMPRMSSSGDNLVKCLLILLSLTSHFTLFSFYLPPDTLLWLGRLIILLSASMALYTYLCYSIYTIL